MIAGVALLVTLLVLRAVSVNRHVRARLMASAIVAFAYSLVAASLQYGHLSAGMQEQLRLVQPLLIAFGAINGLVALVVNPWRADRLPDRYPTIVQDAIVILLFAIAATLLLQEKIFAATAAGAVVVGLALQDTLGNLFAGLAIQIEKPFRVGHWVRIAETDGMVAEVTWRATKVRTKSGNFVVVPNSKLADDIIINYSEPTPESRIEVEVGISYAAAPNEVKAIMLDAIRDEPLLTPTREPEVLIANFADSAITYRIRVWTTDFAADERLRDRIRSAVYYALRRKNIEIPYPMQVQIERADTAGPAPLGRAERDVLRTVSIFAALDEEAHTALAAAAAAGLYATDDAVVREGTEGHSMFVVVSGEVVVTVGAANHEVARIGPGGFFGEMSLLTGAPRNATVRATRDSELLEITVEAFRQFVLANPAAVEAIGVAVASRRAELEQRRAAGSPAAALEPPQTFVDRIWKFLRRPA